MEVFKAIQTRRSVRKYKPEMFPEEKLQKILEAARLALSAHNKIQNPTLTMTTSGFKRFYFN